MCTNNLTSLEIRKLLPNESYSSLLQSNWVTGRKGGGGGGDGELAKSKQEHVNCKHITHQHVYFKFLANGTI